MADTAQFLLWHLEYACPFRQGDATREFFPAYRATCRLQAIDEAAARGDVYGDVCVSGVVQHREGESPWSGFRISEVVAPAGDLEAARRTCRACCANTLRRARKMAGCWGYLSVDPDDEEMERVLRSALAFSPGAKARYLEAFPQTTPIWYGLWIRSPLNRRQLEALWILLPDLPRREAEVARFRDACEASLKHGLPLHVKLPPPGHTDLGYSTTFAHCPRCKRVSRQRWYGDTCSGPETCRACRHVYFPSETASSENDTFDFDRDSLERLLPPAEYEALHREWLARHAGRDSRA